MIVLSDKIRVIQPYDGGSKYDFWKDQQKGDVITIGLHLKPVGHYKPEIIMTNDRTGLKFDEAYNRIQNYLTNMTYESVEYRGVSGEVKNKLVKWLADEYVYTEAKEMIRDAHINEWNGKITITYANGCADVVRIENGKVIQIH